MARLGFGLQIMPALLETVFCLTRGEFPHGLERCVLTTERFRYEIQRNRFAPRHHARGGRVSCLAIRETRRLE